MPSTYLLDTTSDTAKNSVLSAGFAPRPAKERRRGTLLIVDDEEGPRQSLRVVFKGDYDLLIASDGESAIALAREHKVDVAILDIRMVDMTGIVLLERLKEVDEQIEVIMLTAYETIDTVRQALRLGACDYLNKPFDIATVRNAVAAAMERRSLSSEVSQNTEKLRELQTEMEKHQVEGEIMRKRGEIYASVIHEISTPITVISALIQSLDQRINQVSSLEGDDLEMVKDRLKRITRQVGMCIEISRRHLSTLRQGAPQDGAKDGSISWVNQVLANMADLLRVHPASKQSQLVIVPLKDDVEISMNSTDAVQLLLNLVINAFQSSSQRHRVEVRAQLLPQTPRMEDFRNGPNDLLINGENLGQKRPLLAFSVQDNGSGIAPEVLPRIFEPYFSTHQRGQGAGLGLSIVRRFVEQAKGSLHVHSHPGQGSVFTAYLPLRQSTSAYELVG